jgi:DNA topoisomerase IA/ssDNA-binding Zn-finger/Zn-ribbon topoisomerase 1
LVLFFQHTEGQGKNLYFAFLTDNRYNKLRSHCYYYFFPQEPLAMTSLVIVESEAKAQALAGQAGGAYETLLLRSAPMKVSHNVNAAKLNTGETGFQVVPAETEREFAKGLLANLHKDIYVALESDQQGEYWSWMLSKFTFAASKGQKGIRRIHVAGFAGEELAESFRRVEPVQDSAAASFYIRSLFTSCLLRHLRRLLGTVHGPGGLPLDFAALTALALLEEREAAADAFSAPTKWRIAARLSTPAGACMVRLQEAYGITDDGFFRDPGEVKKALALFEGRPLTVKGVAESALTIEPPMPYRFAELLHDAYTLLAMGPARVLHALRTLQAGVAVDGRHTGLITAPFAVIPFPQQATLSRIRKEVSTIYGSGEVVARQPGGHVILPLLPGLAGDHLPDALSAEERGLYDLIRDRALASQMPEASGRNLLLECTAGGCLFQGRSILLVAKGFLKAFAKGYDFYLRPDCSLQDLQAGQQLAVTQIIPEQAAGVAAEYYTFDSFCGDMAEFSVPLESALILMLQEMLDKGYLAVDAGGGFHIEGNAGRVVATLNRAFPAMKGISLSAYFEQTVSEVISGRKNLDFALKQFDQNFIMHGVPLVRVQVPRAVPVREKKSKNIIKSPEPQSLRPAPAAEQAGPQQAPAANKFDASPEAEGTAEVAAVTEAAAMEGEERPAASTRQAEPITADAALAADQPQEMDDAGRVSLAEISTPQEMPGKEDTPDEETGAGPADMAARANAETSDRLTGEGEGVVGHAAEAAAMELAEAQGLGPEAVFAAPLLPAEENGQKHAGVVPADTDDAAQAPAEPQQGRACPDCGRPLLLKNDRFGAYWACSGYPACRHAEESETGTQKMDLPCPLCGQESLVFKRTPTGKKLYVCPGEGCEFMAWSRPYAVVCPSCGFPFLVEKKTAAGQTVLRCPRAGCSYLQALPGERTEGGAVGAPVPARKKVLVRRPAGTSGGSGKKKVLVRRKKG